MTEEVWTPENSQHLVQKYMRVVGYICHSQEENDKIVAKAHDAASANGAGSQAEYALVFAKSLREQALVIVGPGILKSYLESFAEKEKTAARATPQGIAEKPLNTPVAAPTKKSVEEWEAEGIKFRPAVARLPPRGAEEPQDHTPRRRPLESAMSLQDKAVATADSAPWGKSATRMAAWAWEILHPGKTIPVNQATLIGNVLSVLHHAGILREGAVIPVGYGHKADVRGTRKEK